MKRIVLTIPLLFVIVFLFGQTWNTLIPYETTCPECILKKLTKTEDGGFLILLEKDEVLENYVRVIHSMYKYTSEGELEWEKDYDFGAISGGPPNNIGGGRPLDALQLENGNFFMTGKYTDSDTMFMYAFVTDSNGDSLSLKQIPGSLDLNYINGEIFIRTLEGMDNMLFIKLNTIGEVIEEKSFNDTEISEMHVGNNAIFTSYSVLPQKIKKFDFEGNLINEYIIPFENRANFLTLNELGGVAGYRKDLIKLDNNLEEIWEIPFEEIVSIGVPPDYGASGIVSTSDNGYLLTGHFQTTNVYIIKRDKEGDYEWGGIYGSSYLPLTHIEDIVEVEDGYVLVGGNRYSERLWLVKLNEEGLFTNTEEIAGKIIDIKLYPNPVEEELTISLSTPFTGQINIFNSLGQLLKNESVDNIRQINFPLTDFPSAYYWIELQTPENRITLPFVKQ